MVMDIPNGYRLIEDDEVFVSGDMFWYELAKEFVRIDNSLGKKRLETRIKYAIRKISEGEEW